MDLVKQNYGDTIRSDSEDERTVEKGYDTQSDKQAPDVEEGLSKEVELVASRNEEAPMITDHVEQS